MKIIVLYHKSCTDGFGAAFAAWKSLGPSAEYVAVQYGDIKTIEDMRDKCGVPLDEPALIYVLDFSLPKDVMRWFINSDKHAVIWLDHHKTALETWLGDDYLTESRQQFGDTIGASYIMLDNQRSGALLAWEYFNPGVCVPDLIAMIDDRDRWVWALENTAALHEGLQYLKPWSFEHWLPLLELDQLVKVLETGNVLLKVKDNQVISAVKKAGRIVIPSENDPNGTIASNPPVSCSCPGKVVNSPIHQSEIGNALATECGSFGAVWYLDGIDDVRVSLRSNDDYDVTEIAKTYGGGGHKNAAGFSVKIHQFLTWLK